MRDDERGEREDDSRGFASAILTASSLKRCSIVASRAALVAGCLPLVIRVYVSSDVIRIILESYLPLSSSGRHWK